MGGVATLAGCASAPQLLDYKGPRVTAIVVQKTDRFLHLFHENTVLASYRFELGFAPDGHKREFGDGRTPEGQYWIDRKNPNSEFHLSLGISYPNRADRAAAAAMGKPPGGDIFIHGTPEFYLGARDWTVGCIAVENAEVEFIFAMVDVGTPIWINP